MEAGTQFVEISQDKGMAWKIAFHLPSEAIEHRRKFPKKNELTVPVDLYQKPRCLAVWNGWKCDGPG